MSPTDNVIHLVLVTCYILNGAASKIDVRDAHLVMMYNISHDKVAVSKSDRFSPPLRHSRNMHSRSYQVPLCWTQQRKASFSRVIQDCHYHISFLNSLPAIYIFLNLFLIVFFFFSSSFFASQFNDIIFKLLK